eukprot:1841812-Prymnesium_polylepis.1
MDINGSRITVARVLVYNTTFHKIQNPRRSARTKEESEMRAGAGSARSEREAWRLCRHDATCWRISCARAPAARPRPRAAPTPLCCSRLR